MPLLEMGLERGRRRARAGENLYASRPGAAEVETHECGKWNCLYKVSGSAEGGLGMLKLSCLCGQVRIEIPKRPDFINECNCTLCSKSGLRWGLFPSIGSQRRGNDEGI